MKQIRRKTNLGMQCAEIIRRDPSFMGAFAQRGVALVGERGPKLALMPHGTRIHFADDTRSLLAQP